MAFAQEALNQLGADMTVASFNMSNNTAFQTQITTKSQNSTYDKFLQQATNTPADSIANTIKSSANADKKTTETTNFIEQFAYAPNVSAMFNAYLEKQRLSSSTDSKVDLATQRLESNGMDKKQAQSYAKLSVDTYKQILEAQLNSKISEQVAQQKEFKQRLEASTSANPYVQMTGSLVNLYS